MITRRKMIAGTAAFPLVLPAVNTVAQSASPAASPVATPMTTAPTSDQIVPAWLDAQAALREHGQAASEAFFALDVEALQDMGTEEIVAAFEANPNIQELLDTFTLDQVHFDFPEVGAKFSGRYTPEGIIGSFFQGSVIGWEAVPDEEQSGDVPTGSWTGVIGPGVLDLGIELEFTGGADDLEANLAIPAQFLPSTPMTDVAYHGEIPIGVLQDERVVPAGGDVTLTNLYAEEFEWGENTLKLDTVWTGDGQLASVNLLPQFALPELPEQEPITMRLPFDGAWMVYWGGETEFQNYHAPVPAQRFAVDLAVWQDGSTAESPGTDNENYHAFGQPYLAPVSGTVVAALDGLDDITPQSWSGNPEDHIAGNHVVIETDGGFIHLAHCLNGSVAVAEGDTVEAGDVVAAVGNSGNTSESHIHIHAQTTYDLYDPEAIGIPIVFENALENGEPVEQPSILHATIVEHRS